MSRKIKFRVWDGERILYQDDFTWLLLASRGYQAFSNNFTGSGEYTNSLDSKEWHLEQYTGLKDKDGVEIYEGDVIYSSQYRKKHIIGWDEDMAGFSPFCEQIWNAADSYSEWSFDLGRIEVVGNIHQHPHLLKGKSE